MSPEACLSAEKISHGAVPGPELPAPNIGASAEGITISTIPAIPASTAPPASDLFSPAIVPNGHSGIPTSASTSATSPISHRAFSPAYTAGTAETSQSGAEPTSPQVPFVNGGGSSPSPLHSMHATADPLVVSRCKPQKPKPRNNSFSPLPKPSNQQIMTALRQENDAYRAHIVLLQRRVDELEDAVSQKDVLLQEKDEMLVRLSCQCDCVGDPGARHPGYSVGQVEHSGHHQYGAAGVTRSEYEVPINGEYRCG